jgi:ribosome-associated toxin RatA of RatAB toxin-antitoxin module
MGSAKAVETITINCSREDFRKVLSDYAKMPEYLDDLKKTRVDSVKGSTYTVTYFVSIVGKEITYTLELTHTPPGEVSWKLVKGDFMKVNQGKWVLEELGPKKTKATYHLEMGFGLLVPGAVITQLQKTALPKMLNQFKGRAEALYGTK